MRTLKKILVKKDAFFIGSRIYAVKLWQLISGTLNSVDIYLKKFLVFLFNFFFGLFDFFVRSCCSCWVQNILIIRYFTRGKWGLDFRVEKRQVRNPKGLQFCLVKLIQQEGSLITGKDHIGCWLWVFSGNFLNIFEKNIEVIGNIRYLRYIIIDWFVGMVDSFDHLIEL